MVHVFPYLIGRIGVSPVRCGKNKGIREFPYLIGRIGVARQLLLSAVTWLFPYLIGRIGVRGYVLDFCSRDRFPYLIGRIGVISSFAPAKRRKCVSIPHR